MRTSATIFVAVCLVISTIAFTPTASAGPPDSSQVFDVTDNDDVDVWERAIFPLRVDYDGAAESVENPRINAEGTGIGEKSLAKGKMVVYEPGDEIGLSFISDRAVTGDLDNDNITVVAARMTGGNEGDIPNTFSEAIDLLSEDNANDNATFEFVAENTSLDSAGDTEDLSYEASQSGHYVFFAVSNFHPDSNGVSINNGDISFTDVTLLGTDAVSVQEGSADVSQTTENPQPGDDITFDVDASDELGTSDVTHVLAVYNKSGFTDSSHTIEVDSDELDSDFDIQNNSTFEHSIATVDGVADVEDGASVNGIGLADGRVSRAVGAGAMIDFIAEDLDGTAPETTAVDPKSTLNASIDADVDEDGEHTLTIETNSDWVDGTYQYVYLGALGSDKSSIATNAGTFEIGAEPADDDDDDDDGPSGPSGGGDDDDEEPAPAPQPEIEGDAVASSTFDPETQTLSTQIDSAAAGSSVSSSFDTETTERNLQEIGGTVSRVTTSFSQDSQDVQIEFTNSQTNPSEETPDLSEQTSADTIAYANVDTTADDEAIDRVEFEFSVSRDRLVQNDLSPGEVALYRFNDGEYEEYDAAIDSEGDDRVTYTAEVPGLSVFAIGEETDQVTATATPEPDTDTPEPDTDTPEPDTDTPEPDTDTPTTTSDPLIPGFGFMTAILALLAAALIAVRRYSDDG